MATILNKQQREEFKKICENKDKIEKVYNDINQKYFDYCNMGSRLNWNFSQWKQDNPKKWSKIDNDLKSKSMVLSKQKAKETFTEDFKTETIVKLLESVDDFYNRINNCKEYHNNVNYIWKLYWAPSLKYIGDTYIVTGWIRYDKYNNIKSQSAVVENKDVLLIQETLNIDSITNMFAGMDKEDIEELIKKTGCKNVNIVKPPIQTLTDIMETTITKWIKEESYKVFERESYDIVLDEYYYNRH